MVGSGILGVEGFFAIDADGVFVSGDVFLRESRGPSLDVLASPSEADNNKVLLVFVSFSEYLTQNIFAVEKNKKSDYPFPFSVKSEIYGEKVFVM